MTLNSSFDFELEADEGACDSEGSQCLPLSLANNFDTSCGTWNFFVAATRKYESKLENKLFEAKSYTSRCKRETKNDGLTMNPWV